MVFTVLVNQPVEIVEPSYGNNRTTGNVRIRSSDTHCRLRAHPGTSYYDAGSSTLHYEIDQFRQVITDVDIVCTDYGFAPASSTGSVTVTQVIRSIPGELGSREETISLAGKPSTWRLPLPSPARPIPGESVSSAAVSTGRATVTGNCGSPSMAPCSSRGGATGSRARCFSATDDTKSRRVGCSSTRYGWEDPLACRELAAAVHALQNSLWPRRRWFMPRYGPPRIVRLSRSRCTRFPLGIAFT